MVELRKCDQLSSVGLWTPFFCGGNWRGFSKILKNISNILKIKLVLQDQFLFLTSHSCVGFFWYPIHRFFSLLGLLVGPGICGFWWSFSLTGQSPGSPDSGSPNVTCSTKPLDGQKSEAFRLMSRVFRAPFALHCTNVFTASAVLSITFLCYFIKISAVKLRIEILFPWERFPISARRGDC